MKKLLVLMSFLAITAMIFAQVTPQKQVVKKDTQKEMVKKDSLKTDSLKKVSNMKGNQYNQPAKPAEVKKDTTKIKK